MLLSKKPDVWEQFYVPDSTSSSKKFVVIQCNCLFYEFELTAKNIYISLLWGSVCFIFILKKVKNIKIGNATLLASLASLKKYYNVIRQCRKLYINNSSGFSVLTL